MSTGHRFTQRRFAGISGRLLSLSQQVVVRACLIAVLPVIVCNFTHGDEQAISSNKRINRSEALLKTPDFSGCIVLPRQGLRKIPAGGIVKWTDDNGITHYEDFRGASAPDGKLLVATFPETRDFFNLSIEMHPKGGEEGLARALEKVAFHFYDLFRDLITEKRLVRADLDIRIFRDHQAYVTQRDRFLPKRLTNVLGFYSQPSNQIVVFDNGSPQSALAIAAHEIIHAMNFYLFGEIPRWLNEGLAINLSATPENSDGSTVPGWEKVGHRALSNRDASVTELLQASDGDWLGQKRDQYYRLSGLLVSFLMVEADTVLAKTLSFAADTRCQNRDLHQHLAHSYPGGIQALERDFIHWLKILTP